MNTAHTASCYYIFFLIICCSWQSSGFSPRSKAARRIAKSTTTAVGYQNEGNNLESFMEGMAAPTSLWKRIRVANNSKKKNRRTIIRDLGSPEELFDFLEGDPSARPAIVLFYTGWCKNCQIVDSQLDRVARNLGGGNNNNDEGRFRFARFECTPFTMAFVEETTIGIGKRPNPNLRLYTCGSSGQARLIFDAGSSVQALCEKIVAFEGTEAPGGNDEEGG